MHESQDDYLAAIHADSSIVPDLGAFTFSSGQKAKENNDAKASLVGGPRPGGFYRLRVADTTLPQAELAKIVGRMGQEKIVGFAAAMR
jgi:hypothetical protein